MQESGTAGDGSMEKGMRESGIAGCGRTTPDENDENGAPIDGAIDGVTGAGAGMWYAFATGEPECASSNSIGRTTSIGFAPGGAAPGGLGLPSWNWSFKLFQLLPDAWLLPWRLP